MANTHRISGDLELLGIQYMGDGDSTGTSRTIQLVGAETNIGLTITTKGTGTVRVPSGYEANISSDQDLINRAYAHSKIAGIDAGALVTAPGAGQDGYALTYDHATTSYTLTAVATALTFTNGLTKSGSTVKLGGNISDAATNMTQSATGVIRLRTMYTTGSDEAGVAAEAVAQDNNQVTLYAVGGSIRITPTVMEVTAPGMGAMAYAADYRANYTSRSLPDVGYVTDYIAGKSVAANVTGPTASEDSYVIGWTNSTSKYTLIPFPAPSSGYLTVQDEGTSVTQRSILNFVGASVSVADSGGKTVVTFSSSGITNGAAENELMKSDGTNAVGSGLYNLSSSIQKQFYTADGINSGGTNATDRAGVSLRLDAGDGVHVSGANGGDIIISAGSATIGGRSGTTIIHSGGASYTPASDNLRTVLNSVSYTTTLVPKAIRVVGDSPTPAVGSGVGIAFETKTATSNYEVGSIIESVSTDVTSTTEDFKLLFKTMAGGAEAATRMEMDSAGTKIYTTTGGLTVSESDTGTNNIITGLRIERTTSGTAAVGFGVQHSIALENDGGTLVNHSNWDYTWASAVAGAHYAKISLSAYVNGSPETVFTFNSSSIPMFAVNAPIGLRSYSVASVPSAASYSGAMIYVTNETGGAIPAFSDGTNWRRVTDRAVIS